MLQSDQRAQEKYILVSQVISFCLLAIVILVAISFKDQLIYQLGYYHATLMFFVILPLVILIRFLSIQYTDVRIEYLISLFYYSVAGYFLVYPSSSSLEIVLIMPVIITALKYGKNHALYTSCLALITLLYVSFRKGFGTIDSDLMYGVLFVLVAWLLGNLREAEEESRRKLARLADYDGLTGLPNHRFFQSLVSAELKKIIRQDEPLSLVMLDIDFFKVYNDSYGHLRGDSVLKLVAGVINYCTPEGCTCSRYGGEEFALILPGIGLDNARIVGEAIRLRIEKAQIAGSEILPKGKLTISIGIAEYPGTANSKEKLIQKADEALFKAKYLSKNKVETYYSILDELSHNLIAEERDIFNSIRTLTMVINAKDKYTYGHSERVMQLAQKYAIKIRMDQENTRDLVYGALLHDIGKIEVARNILNKTRKLSQKDWEILRQHPQWGADIIRPLKSLKTTTEIVRHHHENYDGSGYPFGLKGEDIPLGARILRVIDSFDAMTTNRAYKEGMSISQALEELKCCVGSHYDPKVVKIFTEIISG